MTKLGEPPTSLLRGCSLFLDFDGTLVELAPTPDAVEVGAALLTLLQGLSDMLEGRIAVVSGRSVGEIEALLHPVALPIGGSHGLEMSRPGGQRESAARPPQLDKAIEKMRAIEASHPGVLVEEKPLGVALHFRQAPHAEDACRTAAHSAADDTGLSVQPGKMVFELKAGDMDKGRALRRFMTEPPFAGTLPVFLGDDVTDESAFKEARALGGAGILVGDARLTAATYRLASVTDAMRWLGSGGEALK